MNKIADGEIVTLPILLPENEAYVAKAGDVLFSEHHTIADIVRYAVDCSSSEEVRHMLDEMCPEA